MTLELRNDFIRLAMLINLKTNFDVTSTTYKMKHITSAVKSKYQMKSIDNFMKDFKFKFTILPSLFFGSLLSGCSLFKPTPSIEIVYPPNIPDNLKNIPTLESSNDFERLKEPDMITETLEIGREDPFLPPQFDSSEINLPKGLILHGIVHANNKLTALVSFNLSSGSIKVGDAGGINTDLLPDGWSVDSIILAKTKVNLKYKNKTIALEIDSQN